MPKRKKKKRPVGFRTIAGTGLLLGTGAIGISALPNGPGVSAIKTSAIQGFSDFSRVFPTIGALGGAALTVSAAGEVVRATKKLTKKRKRR